MVFGNLFKGKGGGSNGGGDTPPGAATPAGDGYRPDPRKARRFFEHAQTVSDARNYDYAVECYVNGLKHDPDNINKHEELFEVAKRRKVGGGKPAGIGERMKPGGPTTIDKMAHAEKLWAMDPTNPDLALAVMRAAVAADKAHEELNLAEVAYWIGGLAVDFNAQQKNKQKLYLEARDLFVEIGAFDKAVEACRRALNLDPSNSQLIQDLKNLEAENTMQQGGYSGTKAEEGGFRKFVRNADKQRALEQEDAIGKTASQADEIVARRRAEFDEDPQDLDKLAKLVDALVAKATPEAEKEAMDLLRQAWEESGQYRYKVRIGDIQMKQMSRQMKAMRVELQKSPDDEELKQRVRDAGARQLAFELKEYQERVKNYPTDMALRYELGRRLYQSGQVDEAIGAFQQAKQDPKQRAASHMYLGQCYLHKTWHDEAINTLNEGIAAYPIDNDKLALDMRYLLMDALFQAGKRNRNLEQVRESQKVASQILQTNINYRDIKHRVDDIRKLVDELQRPTPAA